MTAAPKSSRNSADNGDWLLAEFARMVMEEAARTRGAALLDQLLVQFREAIQRQLTETELGRRSDANGIASVTAQIGAINKNFSIIAAWAKGRSETEAALSQQLKALGKKVDALAEGSQHQPIDGVSRQLNVILHQLLSVNTRRESELQDLRELIARQRPPPAPEEPQDSPRKVLAADIDVALDASLPPAETPPPPAKAPLPAPPPEPEGPALPNLKVWGYGLAFVVLNVVVTASIVYWGPRQTALVQLKAEASPPPASPAATSQPASPHASEKAPATQARSAQKDDADSTPPVPPTTSKDLPETVLKARIGTKVCPDLKADRTIGGCLKSLGIPLKTGREFQSALACLHCTLDEHKAREVVGISILQALAAKDPKTKIDGVVGNSTMDDLSKLNCRKKSLLLDDALKSGTLPTDTTAFANLVNDVMSVCDSSGR